MADRIAGAAARGQAVDARVSYRADDVHDDRPARRLGQGGRPARAHREGGSELRGGGGRARQQAPREQERGPRGEQHEEHETAIELHRRTVRALAVTPPPRRVPEA